MNEITLDKEEQEILHSFERGEWKSVPNVKEEIEKHRNYARQTLKKNKRVNIDGFVKSRHSGENRSPETL